VHSVARRERLRALAEDVLDLKNDPYFMKNHLGSYDCKLCLTIHTNEGSYLAHTQGKRHQQNLSRRAARIARKEGGSGANAVMRDRKRIVPRKTVKIGRPGYKIIKQRDASKAQRAILFQLQYPRIEDGLRPRYRFMSSYEQKIEAPDTAYQYLLFAGEPYETVAFKIPNKKIDRAKFFTHWDDDTSVFTLQLTFVAEE
jgi:splicing factor 3A subunit 2